MTAAATTVRAGPPAPVRSRRRFLPEVQALRAVAVLLVVAYHLRPDLVPGGYIGVDVFFVISGFLITGHMIRDVRTSGRLRLGHFWANRARRILPASLVAILAVVATAPFFIPLAELRNVGRQALGSIFYVQNWLLAADSVDYSNSENAQTPFQHFWSLAVEEQFYLLWPIVVTVAALVSARIARRRGAAAGPLSVCLVAAFLLVIVPSFLWSVALVGEGDPSAYFVTTTRLWELGLGGLLAVVLRYTDGLRPVRAVLALAGLAAIAVGALTLTEESPFPGTAALLPVLGSAAVIAAGRTSGPGSLTPLVDLRPVQWVGNVSYSLYLWHFPVCVYFAVQAGRLPTKFEVLGLLAVMLVLSAASYRWVEQPFRTSTWARRSDRRALVASLVGMGLVAASTVVFWITPAAREDVWDQRAGEVSRLRDAGDERFGAGSARDGSFAPFITDEPALLPNPALEGKPLWLTDSARCSMPHEGATAMCEYGDPEGDFVVAVVGDSHGRMFAQPVIEAAEENGWRVVTFLRNSCPFSLTPRTMPNGEECVGANEDVLERLGELQPDAVVSAFYESSRFRDDGSSGVRGTVGLAAAYDELAATGARVFAVKDAPSPRGDVFACVSENYADPGECAVPRAEALEGRGLTEAAAAEADADVTVIDLTDRFCTETTCPAVIGGAVVYADGNHISDVYGPSLAPDFARELATG
ncbi:acyltransferase family protein [Georgenia alba]|uniref:Acyltransferase family protein n=1 Tax=Georgenia alba TaxID=2233858 RepID=A0ABW2QCC1_9MICO